jgi:hypothetical protein
MSKIMVIINVQTAEKLILREMIFVRGSQPKAFKPLCMIHRTIISKSASSGDGQLRLHGFFSLLSGRNIRHFGRTFVHHKTQSGIKQPENRWRCLLMRDFVLNKSEFTKLGPYFRAN